ncbi:hypothetical protein JRQ81_014776, partial [Phrynocephalus forsythii]
VYKLFLDHNSSLSQALGGQPVLAYQQPLNLKNPLMYNGQRSTGKEMRGGQLKAPIKSPTTSRTHSLIHLLMSSVPFFTSSASLHSTQDKLADLDTREETDIHLTSETAINKNLFPRELME